APRRHRARPPADLALALPRGRLRARESSSDLRKPAGLRPLSEYRFPGGDAVPDRLLAAGPGETSIVTAIESDTTPWEAAADALRSLLRRGGVQQFVKFCLVGATSTVIDFGVLALLDKGAHLPERFLQLFAAHPARYAFAEHHHLGFLIAAAI